MKVSLDLEKKNNSVNNISFGGYKTVKSPDGFLEYEFSYPFDPNNERCFLEVFRVNKDQNNNYFITEMAQIDGKKNTIELKPDANKIDLSQTFGFDDNTPFAYHYVLTKKNNNDENDNNKYKFCIDSGFKIDDRKDRGAHAIYNVVTPTHSRLSKGGSMKLVIIDSQNVGKVYNDQNVIVDDNDLKARGMKGVKTLANKFGGTLAGLEYSVDKGEYDNFNRIISLPIFTDDDFSAHAYWNKNCMQMASSLGNVNNYASLQRKMFAHGLNFVSDGAFVNEGLEGVHFNHLLKWKQDSPYYNWFKAPGMQDNPLSLGVFVKNKKYISHKIVNSPYQYVQNDTGHISISSNPLYDSSKPTYIQFFDTRLVTDREKEDTTSLINSYSKMNAENVYDIHTHDDSVFPYHFEIDPEVYNKNIKNLNKYNDSSSRIVNLDDYRAARFLSKTDSFNVEEKFESGFETWDANTDIAKLNFVFSSSDLKNMKNVYPDDLEDEVARIKRANAQVQDYAVTSGKYWTRKTDDILRLYVAQTLKKVDKDNSDLVYTNMLDKINDGLFPKSLSAEVSKDEVKNVITGWYNDKRVLSNEDKKSQILQNLMNTPLDTIEFGDNIVGVLASPLISKRANTEKEIGVDRYDLFKAGNPNLPDEYKNTYTRMENIYQNELLDYASYVLELVDSALPADSKLFNDDKVTEFGKYVLPLITPEIAKYAMVKALAPDTTVAVDGKTGEISYDYKALKSVHLQTLGITNPSCPEDEAQMLLSSIEDGLKNNLDRSSSSEIVEGLVKSLKDTNLESFKLADLIVDKTQSGLDWRIDATKDIADVEALRNKNANFEDTWNSVISFWNKFSQAVIRENPNAYLVAEVTDERNLHELLKKSPSEKFTVTDDLLIKLERETGFTSTANYNNFFSLISGMFSKSFETGYSLNNDTAAENSNKLFNELIGPDKPFLTSGSLEALLYSYNMISNHDKPRPLHCMALDMGLFNANLLDTNNSGYRETAYRLLTDKHIGGIDYNKMKKFDFSTVSPKAVAVGVSLRTAAIKVLDSYKKNMSPKDYDDAFKAISKAVRDLAGGNYNGHHFNPESFGVKPYDVSIDMILKLAKEGVKEQKSDGSVEIYKLPFNDEQINQFSKDIFAKALEPAMPKLLGMMKYLVALPGMPTLFDGDDVGATGYDTKTKNMTLQGRQRIHDEWLDENDKENYRKFIADNKKLFDKVMKIRRDPRCNALNNGAPFVLPMQKVEGDNSFRLPALFRQSSDGRMAISIFNTAKEYSKNNDARYPYDHEYKYVPKHLTLDSIALNFEDDIIKDGSMGVGIRGLEKGLEFFDAYNENNKYEVVEYNGKYFLKAKFGDKKIHINDSTLVLCHSPKNKPLTFTGQYHIAPSKYTIKNAYNPQNVELGSKLQLVCQ